MPIEFQSPEECVDAIIARVGRDIRLATPLAAGKPNHLLNAFYRRAKSDPTIELTFITALTLERPKGRSELEQRFLGPFVERVFGNYPDLDYELDRVAQRLPDNVRVIEFYFTPGKYLGNRRAQCDYICSNYTDVARDILDRSVNVMAQQVASGELNGKVKLSLSCNPDISVDLMAGMRRREAEGQPIALVAQTNGELPFMFGEAVVEPGAFHFLVHDPQLDYTVFGLPKTSISDAEFAIGLYCSSLVKDGGELQVGFGALGDAIVHALLLRHENNDVYRAVLNALELQEKFPTAFERLGDTNEFLQGLFAASEMMVDGFLQLYRRGVIKRRVYDDPHLQRLLNGEVIDERVTVSTLDALVACGAIGSRLERADVDYLVHFGVFRPQVTWADDEIVGPGGKRFSPDLRDADNRPQLLAACLGERLRHGAVIHAGFFLGDQAFYQALRDLPSEERALIRMRSITRINQLYGHEEIDRLHRRDARFVNTCMMMTLMGAAVSDGLETGEVVSGVGGQYNFVAMAQALPDGHSVVNMKSTRTSKGKVVSNVAWNYAHTTIPRHLRDVYVTEYGIAFVRGKTDEETIKALLNITDSRFQAALMSQAKTAGKLDPGYQLPLEFQDNYPETIARQLAPYKASGHFPAFPFGSDFTEEELVLGKALRGLKARVETPGGRLGAMAAAALHGRATAEMEPLLARMGLESPTKPSEHFYRRLLCAELRRTDAA